LCFRLVEPGGPSCYRSLRDCLLSKQVEAAHGVIGIPLFASGSRKNRTAAATDAKISVLARGLHFLQAMETNRAWCSTTRF
jgi:hypothetical protein